LRGWKIISRGDIRKKNILKCQQNIDKRFFKGVIDFKGIVGAVIIFDHGLKFGIIFFVSYHPAHKKLIASKKTTIE
jgi:hypothetical protein